MNHRTNNLTGTLLAAVLLTVLLALATWAVILWPLLA